MKAITLTQPWASCVAAGLKRIETRSWQNRYRGPIAIHAAKGFPDEARRFADDLFRRRILHEYPLPTGCLVARATLERIESTEGFAAEFFGPHERELGNYDAGRYAWVLADVVRLARPIPYRGALGLWDVPPELVT